MMACCKSAPRTQGIPSPEPGWEMTKKTWDEGTGAGLIFETQKWVRGVGVGVWNFDTPFLWTTTPCWCFWLEISHTCFPISGELNDPSCLAHIFWNDAPVRKGVTALMTGPAGRAIVVGTLLVPPHGMKNLLNAMASCTFVASAPVDWKTKGTKNMSNICVSSPYRDCLGLGSAEPKLGTCRQGFPNMPRHPNLTIRLEWIIIRFSWGLLKTSMKSENSEQAQASTGGSVSHEIPAC